jgi:hypothetical protein
MTDNLGFSVMLNMLFGDNETPEAIKSSLNKVIKTVALVENELQFTFEDDTLLRIFDDGQSCCESRYMVTADELQDYVGATLLNFELKEAPNMEDEYGDHEVQFLDVITNKGVFQMANHNEHNGYYGGFSICARLNK